MRSIVINSRRTLGERVGCPHLELRIGARMQLSVPEVSDLSQEPDHIKAFYGIDAPGSDSNTKDLRSAYARNCILARRLIEKGSALCSFSTEPTKQEERCQQLGWSQDTGETIPAAWSSSGSAHSGPHPGSQAAWTTRAYTCGMVH